MKTLNKKTILINGMHCARCMEFRQKLGVLIAMGTLSEHPLGEAIVEFAELRKTFFKDISAFKGIFRFLSRCTSSK